MYPTVAMSIYWNSIKQITSPQFYGNIARHFILLDEHFSDFSVRLPVAKYKLNKGYCFFKAL